MMTPLDYATLAVIVVIVVLALVSVALLLGVGAGRTGGKQAPATTVVIGEQNDSDQTAGTEHSSGTKVVVTGEAVHRFVEAFKDSVNKAEEEVAPVVDEVEDVGGEVE